MPFPMCLFVLIIHVNKPINFKDVIALTYISFASYIKTECFFPILELIAYHNISVCRLRKDLQLRYENQLKIRTPRDINRHFW